MGIYASLTARHLTNIYCIFSVIFTFYWQINFSLSLHKVEVHNTACRKATKEPRLQEPCIELLKFEIWFLRYDRRHTDRITGFGFGELGLRACTRVHDKLHVYKITR